MGQQGFGGPFNFPMQMPMPMHFGMPMGFGMQLPLLPNVAQQQNVPLLQNVAAQQQPPDTEMSKHEH